MAHHKEVDVNNYDLELNPDWKQYYKLEEAGALRILTARDNGKLVGYFFTLVWPSLHFAQVLQATSDILYVMPEYRRGGTGAKLIKEAEKMMQDAGATRGYIVAKANTAAARMLPRQGYKLVENVFFKVLGNG